MKPFPGSMPFPATRSAALGVRTGGAVRCTPSSVVRPAIPMPVPEVVVVRNADHERLLAALGRLKPKDQEVLRLRAYEHLTLAEVSIVLGCSVPAAKQRSARAMKRLRQAADVSGAQRATPGSRANQRGGGG